MFTGIIEEVGHIEQIDQLADSTRMRIGASKVLSDAHFGDSISVNGVCLTVTEFDAEGFWADVMQVTLDFSTLGQLELGSPVNLERAMSANGRFGGHIVQGHVDGTARLVQKTPSENWEIFEFELDSPELAAYIVPQGSIAINGTSLTIAACEENRFEVSLIPTTLAETMLGQLQVADKVNIECDVLAKYVRSMLDNQTQ